MAWRWPKVHWCIPQLKVVPPHPLSTIMVQPPHMKLNCNFNYRITYTFNGNNICSPSVSHLLRSIIVHALLPKTSQNLVRRQSSLGYDELGNLWPTESLNCRCRCNEVTRYIEVKLHGCPRIYDELLIIMIRFNSLILYKVDVNELLGV